MLDTNTNKPAATRRPDAAAETTVPAGHITRPWLAVMLDQVDHPMILLADDQTVLHANRAAQLELAGAPGHEHPLAWRDGKLALDNVALAAGSAADAHADIGLVHAPRRRRMRRSTRRSGTPAR